MVATPSVPYSHHHPYQPKENSAVANQAEVRNYHQEKGMLELLVVLRANLNLLPVVMNQGRVMKALLCLRAMITRKKVVVVSASSKDHHRPTGPHPNCLISASIIRHLGRHQ